MPQNKRKRFVLCVRNGDAEDYLYPQSCFIAITLPAGAQEAMLIAN
jgi:hypothetical protein